MCTDLMNVNDWNDWIWIHTLQGPLLVIFTSTLKLQIQNVYLSPQWHSAYWQQWHEKLSTFLDPNTKGSKDHTNASSHSCFFLLFFQKQSFAFRCYSMCRRIKGMPAVFKQIPISRFRCTKQICEHPTASFQKRFFLCVCVCIVVKMKMCQQIRNIFKFIFYIKGIPQNFCPSEAVQGSWQASYLFRASQQASYLFRASQQALVAI